MIPPSAGILLYRAGPEGFCVLLVHPGGPYWRYRDEGAWQIPKGRFEGTEDPEACARREVEEELGIRLTGELRPLGEIVQSGGKRVTAFALEQDVEEAAIVSNTFELEWPAGSGRRQSFPEVDAARWMSVDQARRMMLPSQQPLLDRLLLLVGE